MRGDVINIATLYPRVLERPLDGSNSASRFRIMLGNGVGVKAATGSQDFRVDHSAAPPRLLQILQNQDGGPFSKDKTISLAVERARNFRRGTVRPAQCT